MKGIKAISGIILVFIIIFLILEGIEELAGYLWFDSYDVKAYETAIDHYLILKVFLLIKTLFICFFFSYVLLRFSDRKFWKIELMACLLLLPLLYFMWFIKYRCDHVYDYLKSPYIIYEGRFFEYDSMLGKRAIKNATGYQDYWIKTGPDFRKRLLIDSLGFRVSDHKYQIKDSSLLLYLGCSYTWGDGCRAEETYPYLVSSKISAPYINAGQSAYGLGQMALLAERLIPAYHPKYVFVQYSPWLVQRSLTPFKQTVLFADIAFPYVSIKKGTPILNPPVFESGLLSFDSEHYRITRASIWNKLHFYFDYGVRVVCHDLIARNWYLLCNMVSSKNSAASSDQAERFLYKRIFDVADQYGCKVYVVKIGSITDEAPLTKGLFDGRQLINSDSTLKATAKGDKELYGKLFYHWAIMGKDTVIADVHPNPCAHSIIASDILARLEKDK